MTEPLDATKRENSAGQRTVRRSDSPSGSAALDRRDAVDMAGHQMAAELVAECERAFQIHSRALAPIAESGSIRRLARHIDREPARPLVHHRQAGSRAGDGGTERDRGGIVGGADLQPEPAAGGAGDGPDSAHVGDDP